MKIKEETYMHLSLSLSTPVIFILSRHNLILIVAYAGIQCSTSQIMSSFDLKTRSNMNIFFFEWNRRGSSEARTESV